MLFLTNRAIRQSKRTRIGRPIDFDLADNSAGQSLYFCQREKSKEYVELGNKQFFSLLKESEYEQILFYLHGFSDFPEEYIFLTAQQLQQLFNRKQPNLVQVIPPIWPCSADVGIIKDYWNDQTAADASGFAFARAFE